MRGITIELTPEQIEKLAPLWEATFRAHEEGMEGVVIAQTNINGTRFTKATFSFIEHDKALVLVAVLNPKWVDFKLNS